MQGPVMEFLTWLVTGNLVLVLAVDDNLPSRFRSPVLSYNHDWSPGIPYSHQSVSWNPVRHIESPHQLEVTPAYHWRTPTTGRMSRFYETSNISPLNTISSVAWGVSPGQRIARQSKGRAAKISPIWSEPEEVQQRSPPTDETRAFSPDSIQKFTETLGAINTVGRYIVNMTKSYNEEDITEETEKSDEDVLPEDVPGAIYTISKNVFGRNVTDTIAPLVRQFPLGKVVSENNGKTCTTPDGTHGECDDLSACPELLLDLSNLRQSICFKSLFVPGVCCPLKQEKPITIQSTTRRPIVISTTVRTTTTRRPFPSTTLSPLPPLTVDTRECGEQEIPGFRVVGGTESNPGQWPWLAAIFLHGTKRTEFWCGGSLIGKRHILTAAHCTRDSRQKPFNPRQFTVRLGDIDLKSDDEPSSPETYNVVEVRAHPRFSRVGFYNDIAIMVLDRDVRKSKYVIPLCLPTQYQHEKFIGSRPTVVGWGTTYYGGKESSVQRQAELPIWRNEDCDRAYFQPINENFVCAGFTDGGKDACQGDSGGPLMLRKDHRWMQIGIVSFGNKCGEPGYPGVYTRVTQYLDWIQQNTI